MTAASGIEIIEITPEPKEPEATPASTSESIHEQIAALAYALWHERGSPEGSPDVDWLAAEARLAAKDK
jgi:hypothetical protein